MRVILSDFISLDGVVQAPGGAEEDTENGFEHGGWSMPFFDEETMGDDLIEQDLVDEYRLMIEPVILGGGKRLFPEQGTMRPLQLVDTSVSATGVQICTYLSYRHEGPPADFVFTRNALHQP